MTTLNLSTLITKKASIILHDQTFDNKLLLDFNNHEVNFRPVLHQLLKESHTRLAARDCKLTLNPISTTPEVNLLSKWQEKSTETWFSFYKPVEVNNSQLAYEKFNVLKQKFNAKPNLEEISRQLVENSTQVLEAVRVSQSYWGDITNYGWYNEMVNRFSTLFANLSSRDMSFLTYFVQWDEQGLLFLFWKFIYCKLGYILGTQLIIALYKKGAFIEFLSKALHVARTLVTSKGFIGMTRRTTLLVASSFTTISVTLFSYCFAFKHVIPMRSLQQGFSGDLGQTTDLIRNVGGQLCFELGKTASTLTNAAFLGFIEPKQELVKHLLKRD